MSILNAIYSRGGTIPPPRPGQLAYIGGGGDSISVQYPGLDPAKSYQRYCADTIGASSYFASAGHPGKRTDEILTTYASDVISNHANYVLIEGGVNDVAQGADSSVVITNLKAMVDMVVADNSIAVYLPIFPWSNGTDSQMAVVDTVNAAMIAWMGATYPSHIVADLRQVLGKYRSSGPSGNYWDYQDAYNQDGTHPSEAGYHAAGVGIGNIILSRL